MQSSEPGQGTRKFKPHRADGKRAETTRRTLPGWWSPTLGLIILVLGRSWYGEAVDGGIWWERPLVAGVIGMGAMLLVGWVRDLVRWHADKG